VTEPSPLAPDIGPTPRRRPRGIGPFTTRHLLAILGVVVGAGLLLALVTTPITGPPPTARPGSTAFLIGTPVEGLRVGDRAPELSGTIDGKPVDLVDLDGRPIRLADLRGHPVWINFWASWCPPCQQETPVLRSIFATHQSQGLIVLGVSVQESSADNVREYVRTYQLGYPIGFDATSAIFKTYRVFALPTQVFLDRDGVIQHVENGPLTTLDAERILAPILAGVAPSGSAAP
jgi:cytochrome c biogenesis protein CcmG/thiol:disulfide interchange protein DsbE